MTNHKVKKVTIYQPRIPSYRTKFFEVLRQLGNDSGINYRVIAPSEINDSRNDEDLRNKSVERIRTIRVNLLGSEIHFFNVKKVIFESDLVISEHALHDFLSISRLLNLNNFPLALWGHGRTYTERTNKIKEILKKTMIKRAEWYFAYTNGVAKYVEEISNTPKRITVLNNSIDVDEIENYMAEMSTVPLEDLRRELSLFSQQTAIFIGALDDSKRIDFILEATRRVKEVVPNFELVICGDGPDRSKILRANIEGVHYLGFGDAQLKAKLSQIGLFILNPGRVGLLAVDSFSLGLPIITTNWQFHAPEFEYLENNKTAIITNDSVEDYVSAIVDYLGDEEKICTMKINCREERHLYSIEKMAARFHEGVTSFMKGLDNA